ncbi:MAG: hypothetical protein WCB70_18685, partial [Xanthobacteraceae bacterium]
VYLAPRRGDAQPGFGQLVIFWTALAVGILIKGPMILMVVGLAAATLVVLDRSARWLLALRPIPGLLWLLVLVLPWFIAIYARVGPQFLIGSVGEDMLAKVASPQETHGAPPGLYLILFFVTFFPASILAGLAAPAVWAVRREAAARFLLAWLVPSWIVFEGSLPSCRTTCCRSIRLSRSLPPAPSNRGFCRAGHGSSAAQCGGFWCR